MTALSRRRMLQLAMAPAAVAGAQVDDLAPTVSRVYPGPDGKLVYVPDEQGNTILDSSYAGYGGGGVRIPTVPVKETIWPVAGDNTANIQAAIDKVSALPLDKSGFRGAVLLRAGYYRMATSVMIQASGVVLRGEGMGDTGTILVGTGTGRAAAPAGAAGGPGGPGGPGAAAVGGGRGPGAPGGPGGPGAAGVAAGPGGAALAGGRGPGGAGGPGGPGGAAAAGGRGPGGPGGAAAAGGRGPGGPGGPGGQGAAGGRGAAGGPPRGMGGGQPTLIRIAGASGVVIKDETKQLVTDEYVPVGSRKINVASARGFKVGDTVILRRIGNQEWVTTVGMGPDNRSGWRAPFNMEWDRVIVAIKGNTITIDVPITCAIEKRWGGGELMKYEDPGRIERVGVENLRGMSEYDPTKRTKQYGNMDRPNYAPEEYYSDENHWSNFITFDNIKHGWVRNATALHFVYSMVGTQRGSKWITVQDCISREPISQRAGARRFTFALRGQLALVQRCVSDKGRHSFMMGQPTSSNNVFLDCKATNPYSSSEPHEQWATGGLYDNIQAPLTARFWKNINIGWAGANTVFWNCEGYFLVQKPPTAQNFSFGHIGVDAVVFNIPLQDPTKEGGYIESLDRHVSPRSLYLTQLRERLGEEAIRNVAASSQKA